MIENPLNPAIKFILQELANLEVKWANALPSTVMVFVFFIVLLMLFALWPYGWIVVIADMLLQFIVKTGTEMGGKTMPQKMAYVIIIGIYFVVWLPFALCSLPFLLIGWIGQKISEM